MHMFNQVRSDAELGEFMAVSDAKGLHRSVVICAGIAMGCNTFEMELEDGAPQ